MVETVQIGDPQIEVTVRHSPRAKRYGLRISPRDGRVYLIVPKGGTVAGATDFAMKKYAWLRRHAVKMATPETELRFGSVVPVLGEQLTLAPSLGKEIYRVDDRLFVPGNEAKLPTRLNAYLKALTRDWVVPMSEHYAAELDREFNKIVLRDTRSRWGSCSAEGRLMYSLRLSMAPPEVLKYVVVHEVCHLVEMNHSSRFWAHVERLMPDYKHHKAWLRAHGQQMQSIPL
ncbi:MAG: SprT family zinc-dependent metalloprotease [Pseudomonadota bacterium]